MDNDLGQQIIDGVDARGWYLVNVLPNPDGSDGNEHCSYTIGLSKNLQWPEIICFGLNGEEAGEMLRLAIAECWERRIVPSAGMILDKVLQDAPAKLGGDLATLENYLGLADWYAEQSGLPRPQRLQLLWPDRTGKFPDEDGCEPEIKAAQKPRMTA